jgi:hypothetical protein
MFQLYVNLTLVSQSNSTGTTVRASFAHIHTRPTVHPAEVLSLLWRDWQRALVPSRCWSPLHVRLCAGPWCPCQSNSTLDVGPLFAKVGATAKGCTAGYDGVACRVCVQPGYYRLGDRCLPCPQTPYAVITLFALGFGAWWALS